MTEKAATATLDRYTEIGALSGKGKRFIKRINPFFAIALGLESLNLWNSGNAGAGAFALMGAGCCLATAAWSSGGIGLPLLPMMAIQGLVIYGVPIAVSHDVISNYPPEFVWSSGIELFVFNIAMVIAWRAGMQIFSPSPPVCRALHDFDRAGVMGWTKLGFSMIVGATVFEILQGLNLLDGLYASLPTGVTPIVTALLSVVSACGFFLVSMIVSGRDATLLEKMSFWILLVVNAMISAADFLLASAAANLITVAIGFFWSNGRFPWRYLTIAMLSLSFLNTGKTTMRERYWASEDKPTEERTLLQLPATYAEWIQVSYDAVLENRSPGADDDAKNGRHANKNQTLLDRIDNLQNLLFVIDATSVGHVPLLHGDTYSIIPPLLVPRILWPEKPRSHEGQVMLNVHFGRQDLNSTLATYIAWGLLPEAYGNFGPIAGSLMLGVFLGIFFSWIENMTARKLIVSLEGFLSLSLMMNLMNSFEMVASVLVTTIFQSFVIIFVASFPFVQRTVGKRQKPADQ